MRIAKRILCKEDKPALRDLLCLTTPDESIPALNIDFTPSSNLTHSPTTAKHAMRQAPRLVPIYKIEKLRNILKPVFFRRYENGLSSFLNGRLKAT